MSGSESSRSELKLCDHAKRRMLSVNGDPFVFADWERVVFLHFLLPHEAIEPELPHALQLEVYQGKACVTLVALTMRHFRPSRLRSLGWFLRPIACQRFLNVRTYVRCGEETGAYFFWGWLSQPFRVALPSGMIGLPYRFGSIEYGHHLEQGRIYGRVRDAQFGSFEYQGDSISADKNGTLSEPTSLAEFALERYSGFFAHKGRAQVFRAWHPPWLQVPLKIAISDDSLLRKRFPWFARATFAGAQYARGFEKVWLGRARSLKICRGSLLPRRHALSSFYEMP
jgi:uncharacterized protein YqjF (DUF2071 family)